MESWNNEPVQQAVSGENELSIKDEPCNHVRSSPLFVQDDVHEPLRRMLLKLRLKDEIPPDVICLVLSEFMVLLETVVGHESTNNRLREVIQTCRNIATVESQNEFLINPQLFFSTQSSFSHHSGASEDVTRDSSPLRSPCSDNFPIIETTDTPVNGYLDEINGIQETDTSTMDIYLENGSFSEDSRTSRNFLPWPTRYELPPLPPHVENTLRNRQPLNRAEKQRILDTIYAHTTQFTYNPTQRQYSIITSALVEKFPYLASTAIPGLDPTVEWRSKIANKFRNERRRRDRDYLGRKPEKRPRL